MAEIELFFSLPLEINQIGLMVVFFGISLSLLRQYSKQRAETILHDLHDGKSKTRIPAEETSIISMLP